MKKEKLLICDHDLSYLEYLTDYLNRQEDFPFQAVPFTRKEALCGYLEKEHCRFLLLDQELGDGEEREFAQLKVIFLREEPGDGICRYQSGPELSRQILERFQAQEFPRDEKESFHFSGEEDGEGSGRPAGGRILGVYSPVSRCGKTIFAVTLGMILAEQEPVLYWNLESYHGMGDICGTEGQYDLADILYRYRSSSSEGIKMDEMKGLFREAVTDWGGLDCLNPAFTAYDLNEVTPEEWRGLLDLAMAAGGYRTIVLDIGTQIREVFSLLDECSLIFTPVLNDRISKAKLRQFEENLRVLKGDSVGERLRKVAVPRLRSDSELSGFPRQLPRGKIGSYVRQIIAAEAEEEE